MAYSVRVSNTAKTQLKLLRAKYPRVLDRVILLLDGVLLDPRIGLGKPERLKHYDSREVWSRRIDKKNRLVYEIRVDEITILSIFGHYTD